MLVELSWLMPVGPALVSGTGKVFVFNTGFNLILQIFFCTTVQKFGVYNIVKYYYNTTGLLNA